MSKLVAVALAYVVVSRVFELWLGRRNTARIVARGGHVVPDASTGLLIGVHAAWLVALCVEELVLGPRLPWPNARLAFAVLFVLAECARYLCMHALGDRWTVRIVVEPGAALIARGPYRRLRHPNYLAAAVALVTLPLALGLVVTPLVFLPLKWIALHGRIGAEERALEGGSDADAAASI